MVLNNDEEPVMVGVTFRSCIITDQTPFYSDLYGERLSVQPVCSESSEESDNFLESPKVNIEMIKWVICTNSSLQRILIDSIVLDIVVITLFKAASQLMNHKIVFHYASVYRCSSLKASKSRGWDAQVVLQVPSTMSVSYVHTHRYFCAILDFWQQFLELIDMIFRNNISKSLEVCCSDEDKMSYDSQFTSNTIFLYFWIS